MRPSFTMGGSGGGIAHDNREELHRDRRRGPALLADRRGAAGGGHRGLEGIRARADARQARQRGGRLPDRERRSRWACTPATRSPSPRRSR
ncbi:MAG: hypothetical protein ACLUUF_05955 [Bifidobacterium pullorum]